MACPCNDPKELNEILQLLEEADLPRQIVMQKCVDYSVRDGVDTFVLLGLTNQERVDLIEFGWINLPSSYIWVKEDEA